jgi:hypothetical protein
MKKVIAVLFIIVAIFFGWYSLQGGESESEYISRILEERAEKEVFFESSSESPFKEIEFTGLDHFAPDPAFKVTARLIDLEEKRMVTMVTNDDKTKRYREWGLVEFELGGAINQLMIYEMIQGPFRGTLFLPFADETSALTTYGGGRYLDVKNSGTKSIVLDFNMAYNPYCAYAEGYSCALPPPGNILEIPIEAGEKIYPQ